MVLHPVDQRGERRVGRGLRLQHRAELRLVARPARIEHEVARDQVGGRRAEIGLDQGQRHVDAGGDAGRGPDLAVDDVERLGIDRQRRETLGQPRAARPVRRHPLAVEQPGRRQHEGAGADRAVASRARRHLAQPAPHVLARHRRLEAARAAGDQQGVGLAADLRRLQRHAAVGGRPAPPSGETICRS